MFFLKRGWLRRASRKQAARQAGSQASSFFSAVYRLCFCLLSLLGIDIIHLPSIFISRRCPRSGSSHVTSDQTLLVADLIFRSLHLPPFSHRPSAKRKVLLATERSTTAPVPPRPYRRQELLVVTFRDKTGRLPGSPEDRASKTGQTLTELHLPPLLHSLQPTCLGSEGYQRQSSTLTLPASVQTLISSQQILVRAFLRQKTNLVSTKIDLIVRPRPSSTT